MGGGETGSYELNVQLTLSGEKYVDGPSHPTILGVVGGQCRLRPFAQGFRFFFEWMDIRV